MKIEDNVGIFTISELDQEMNQTLIGEFKVKLTLSPLDILAIDRDYRELLGPVNPLMATGEANDIAFALSQLKHRVLSSPSFWKGLGFDGGHLPKNVLYSVLDKSIELQDMFKKQKQDEMEAIQARLIDQVKNGAIKKKVEEDTDLTEDDEE